jgi:hypothetical protein
MMQTMLSFYIKAYEAVKAVLQEHLKDGSQLCLTSDGWSASNSNSYLSVTVYWTDVK